MEYCHKKKEFYGGVLTDFSLNSIFFAKFGRSISRDTICRILQANPFRNPAILGAVEKYWIVEHEEKYTKMTNERLGQIFCAEFGRSVGKTTVKSLLKKRGEILERFASWAEVHSVKIRPSETDCMLKLDEMAPKSQIADQSRDLQ